MKMRPGEKLIDKLDSVEDTKGNNGERGSLNLSIPMYFLSTSCVQQQVRCNMALRTESVLLLIIILSIHKRESALSL